MDTLKVWIKDVSQLRTNSTVLQNIILVVFEKKYLYLIFSVHVSHYGIV